MDAGVRGRILAAVLAATPAAAQDLSIEVPSRPEAPQAGDPQAEAPQTEATAGTGAVLRVLDKIDGTVTDLEVTSGGTAEVGPLQVVVAECRYPSANPSGDAYALVSIRAGEDETALFEGWLIASSPALNAMDHPRYDVWALRCLGA